MELNCESPSEISRILYAYILGIKKSPRTPSVESISAMMGIKPVTLYKKLEGENPLRDNEVIAIYNICRQADGKGPIDALRYFVTACDPRLYVGSIEERGNIDGRLFEDVNRLTTELRHIASSVAEALKDNRIDRQEKETVGMAMDDLQNALDHLREEIAHSK